MEGNKNRLDVLIYERGLVDSREKAKSLIMAGIVFVDGFAIDKPGTKVSDKSNIEIKGSKLEYVSRGGLKLAKAIKYFNIDVSGKIALDVGSSTGGFTDCLLKNGASKVYSIDVGYGQLAWELRNDSRVIVMERTNIRYVTPDMLPARADFASIDVSFISLAKVMPSVIKLLSDNGEIICLIKPQFEAGREKVGKKGVVRDPNTHKEVIMSLWNYFEDSCGLTIKGLTYSPVKGPEGNIEYLISLYNKDDKVADNPTMDLVSKVVEEAHIHLIDKKV